MHSLPGFVLRRPESVDDVLALLTAVPDARLVGGGTDLVPNLRRGLHQPAALIDLSGVHGLATIASDEAGGLVIGSGVTLAALAADARVRERWPALAEAAHAIAAPAHRSVATVAGNLCQDTRCVYYNQSEWWRATNGYCLKRGATQCHVAPQGERCHAAFCSDLAPVLLVANAEVELRTMGATRRLPLAQMYRDDGANHLTLAPGEFIAHIAVPAPGALRTLFAKTRIRGGIDFPLAAAAVGAELDGGRIRQLRVGLSGTNSHPVLLEGTDEFIGAACDDALLDQLGKRVQRQVSPMRSTIAPADYRRQVAAALVKRLLRRMT